MKYSLAAAGLVALATTSASADPINKYTITGRSTAAATAQGVPLDQTPKPPAPDEQNSQEGGGASSTGAAAAPAKPPVERYGLLGLSWRSR